MNRRDACRLIGSTLLVPSAIRAAEAAEFKIRYVLSSAMYGDMLVDTVLGEVKKAGAESVDIWRKGHATQREQITEMGDEAFQALLKKHGASMRLRLRTSSPPL